MITVIHILADGTKKDDITGTEVPKEKCKQLYQIITNTDSKPTHTKKGVANGN